MRVLIFLGLKVLEILAIIFVPYGIGRLVRLIPWVKECFDDTPYWLIGILIIFLLGAVGVILFALILKNWELADFCLKIAEMIKNN